MTDKLTQQEEDVMRVVWKIREGNVKTFLENMPDTNRPPYTTLASTIKNLEKKGYLQSRQIGMNIGDDENTHVDN